MLMRIWVDTVQCWYNIIQKVKKLPVNKDNNASAVFSISIEHLTKLEKET